MPRRFSGSYVATSLSTRGAFMPAWMVQHVAAAAGVDGIDVDALSPLGTWLAARTGATTAPQIPVRSLWLPLDWRRSPRVARLVETVTYLHSDQPPLVVVVVPGAFPVRELVKHVETFRSALNPAQLVVGLPSPLLRGGRPHLVQLGGIRRFAEEWDFRIAIDLSGRFDPTWEAEAAIARLGERLRLIRLPASAPSRAAIGRDRVACRALHAALDRDGGLDVAFTFVRPVPFPVTPRAASQAAERATIHVADRVASQTRALREGIDHFEGSPTPRGG